MRRVCFIFVLAFLIGCNEDFDKQKTIGFVDDEVAFLDMERINADSLGFIFELQSPSNFRFLSVIESDLICDSVDLNNCYIWHKYYPKRQDMKLWYRISGEVLSPNPQEIRKGKPFILTKAERILSCPVTYHIVPMKTPLISTGWKMVGFIDEDGEIYSHPACETNNITLQFSGQSLNDYPQNLPEGKRVEVHTGNYLFNLTGRALSYSVIESSNKIRLKYLSSPFFIPGFRNYVMHDGPRTNETRNKSDSLFKILGSDTIDYVLENNILTLRNSKKKLNAMFVAN